MGGNNELKFGFGFRDLTTTCELALQRQRAGRDHQRHRTTQIAYVWRDGLTDLRRQVPRPPTWATCSRKNRLTLNVGARFDQQTAKNLRQRGAGQRVVPEPASRRHASTGNDQNLIEWNDISPRVGLELRARRRAQDGGARLVRELRRAALVRRRRPTRTRSQYGYLAYGWNDRNNDRFVQPSEVEPQQLPVQLQHRPAQPGRGGAAPSTRSTATTSRSTTTRSSSASTARSARTSRSAPPTPGAGPPTGATARAWPAPARGDPTLDSCPIIGPERLHPERAVHRERLHGLHATRRNAGARDGGRRRTSHAPTATGYSHDVQRRSSSPLTKRLSNRWMGRVAFSLNDWTEHWDGTPYGVCQSTFAAGPGSPDARSSAIRRSTAARWRALSGGSGKASFYTSVKWQLYANALVQLPLGHRPLRRAVRQAGRPLPDQPQPRRPARDGTLRALATPEVDTNRYDNVWNLDLRLAKTIKFGGVGPDARAPSGSTCSTATSCCRAPATPTPRRSRRRAGRRRAGTGPHRGDPRPRVRSASAPVSPSSRFADVVSTAPGQALPGPFSFSRG